jgi:hypothetical protein
MGAGTENFANQMNEFAQFISTDGVFLNCSHDEAARRGAHLSRVRRLSELLPTGVKISVPGQSSSIITAQQGSASWARTYWDTGFESGGFYDYVRGGAIRAAITLFGDQARQKLIEQAHSVPAEAGQMTKRVRLVDDFLSSHDYRPPTTRSVNDLSESAKQVLLTLRDELRESCPRQDAFIRNRRALDCAICLLDVHEFGAISMSGTFLRDWITRSEEVDVTLRSCLRGIASITEGDPSCCLPVLRIVEKGKKCGNRCLPTRFMPSDRVLSLIQDSYISIDNIGDTSRFE